MEKTYNKNEAFNWALSERDKGALFIVNHSGGKDSQAMTIFLRKHLPDNQLLVIHAHLPEVEWAGTMEHVYATAKPLEIKVCQAGKTFLGMVEKRGMWPSAQHRQCTSDLKRGPIEKLIRHELKARGLNRIVSCMGIRAEESTARAKKPCWKFNARNSKAGRVWHEWYPIFDMLIDEVFAMIENAGQEPHWAYSKGMTRLSCCFCILASKGDLNTAAKLNPELFQRYIALESQIDFTFKNGMTLREAAGL